MKCLVLMSPEQVDAENECTVGSLINNEVYIYIYKYSLDNLAKLLLLLLITHCIQRIKCIKSTNHTTSVFMYEFQSNIKVKSRSDDSFF